MMTTRDVVNKLATSAEREREAREIKERSAEQEVKDYIHKIKMADLLRFLPSALESHPGRADVSVETIGDRISRAGHAMERRK